MSLAAVTFHTLALLQGHIILVIRPAFLSERSAPAEDIFGDISKFSDSHHHHQLYFMTEFSFLLPEVLEASRFLIHAACFLCFFKSIVNQVPVHYNEVTWLLI